MNNHPIHEAAKQGQVKQVQTWLQQDNQWVNYLDSEHNTPLHLAAVHGHPKTVKCLLQNGTDFSLKNQGGHTAFTWIAVQPKITIEHKDIIALLLHHGDNPNQFIMDPTRNATCLIHRVLNDGDITFLRLLLSYGANPNHRDQKGRNGVEITFATLCSHFFQYHHHGENEYYVSLMDDDESLLRYPQYLLSLKELLLASSSIDERYFNNPIAEACHAEFDYAERLKDGEGVMTSMLTNQINALTNTCLSIAEMIQILAYPFFKEFIKSSLALKKNVDQRVGHLKSNDVKQVGLLPKNSLCHFLMAHTTLALHRQKKLEREEKSQAADVVQSSTLLTLPPEIMDQIWHWVAFFSSIDACRQEMAFPDYCEDNNTPPTTFSP